MSNPEEDEVEASRAPLLDHLIELRTRLIRAMIAVLVAFVVCFFFAKPIYNFLLIPYVWAAGNHGDVPRLIYTAPQEFFLTQLKVALFGALFIAFPVIATQIYKFVAPGLYKNERNAFLPYLIATPILFVAGGAVVIFILMPLAHALLPVARADRRHGHRRDPASPQGQRVPVAGDRRWCSPSASSSSCRWF